VIHTVGPVYGRTPDHEAVLGRCHTQVLRVADELGARIVAFPAISTGVYGYPLPEARHRGHPRGPRRPDVGRRRSLRAVRRSRLPRFRTALDADLEADPG
jgi:hypothetical protein